MRLLSTLLIALGACLMTTIGLRVAADAYTAMGPCSSYETGDCWCVPLKGGYSYYCSPQTKNSFCDDVENTCKAWNNTEKCTGRKYLCSDNACTKNCNSMGIDCPNPPGKWLCLSPAP